jgi:hypothetical protein
MNEVFRTIFSIVTRYMLYIDMAHDNELHELKQSSLWTGTTLRKNRVQILYLTNELKGERQ